MNSRRMTQKDVEREVPGIGGPGSDESSPDGQRALRLHARIAAVAVILSAFVTWVFIRFGSIPLATVFGVVAAISLVLLGWALYRKRRGERSQ
ncbi:hypothetical protein [Pseudonocardia acidicola]|uniref:Uncharacterized protein n=1 Tax=Pseudonocardia acidicola TaxID=2724939 RepID=A0ABX1SBT7_9PSEU|nr:hypothetical protein [Pseudonocardia acidicola]NMH98369.1 hypothetical protein [Pseudonocardia acidicola]